MCGGRKTEETRKESMRATAEAKEMGKMWEKSWGKTTPGAVLTVLPYHGIAYVGVTSCHVRIGWNLNKDHDSTSKNGPELSSSSPPDLNDN